MTRVSRTATFGPGDDLARILADLTCPRCGYAHPERAHLRITENRIRFFCENCAAFVTIDLTDEQARAFSQAINLADSALDR
jgi:transcription elongation factor Elf1